MSLSVEQIWSDEPSTAEAHVAVPVAVVHGFTQNTSCLRPFGQKLAETLDGASITLIDAPGHGRSGHDDADLIDAARLLVEAGGDAHYVGYSMGGRMLLHAALLFPGRFRSLTLIGATAGIDDHHDRAARAIADEQLAERLESVGLEAFIDDWLALPLFATLTSDAACREARLENRADGLASSLRRCGTGNQFPLWSWLGQIDVPVQVIVGTSDVKFTALGHRMVDHLSNGQFHSVEGGHAVHSERPAEAAQRIAAFINGVSAGVRLDEP